MRTRDIAILCAGVVAFGLIVDSVRAQGHHHPLHLDFYRHWKEPGSDPPRSCCDARVNTHGVETGDCEPTHSIIRNGHWFVWVRQLNRYEQVPEGKILRERNPNVENAHLCWTPARGIICFVPEDTGG
jgi:hypothetical protein